jgi:hypothetical protein
MRRRSLTMWVLGLGAAVWLSGQVVDTRPAYALVVILAVLMFSAVVAHPTRRPAR